MGMLANKIRGLDKYLQRKDVVEIQVNEPGYIWLEIDGKGLIREKAPELNLEYFRSLALVISNGQDISNFWHKPYLACTLPGGHRMQLCLGYSLKTGVAMSIRMARPRRYTLDDYGLSDEQKGILQQAVIRKDNVVISGGTFSGKTQLLNAIIATVASEDRVITVEDAPELDLNHVKNRVEFIVQRLARAEDVGYQDVIDAITRLRPDRVIAGELSMQSSWIMLRLLNTGHGGLLTTIHANSPMLAFEAIGRNIELAGHSARGVIEFFRTTINLVVQIAREPTDKPGSYVRRVTQLYVPEECQQ